MYDDTFDQDKKNNVVFVVDEVKIKNTFFNEDVIYVYDFNENFSTKTRSTMWSRLFSYGNHIMSNVNQKK